VLLHADAPVRDGALGLLGRLLDVVAGGERLAAGTGEDDDPHLGSAVRLGPRRYDLVDEGDAERVVAVGTVERDGGDAVVHRIEQVLITHGCASEAGAPNGANSRAPPLAPRGPTISGLISRLASVSTRAAPKRENAAIAAAAASRSQAALPRAPRSSLPAAVSSNIARASSGVTGPRRTLAWLASSTSTPPGPTTTKRRNPLCVRIPTITSPPASAVACTTILPGAPGRECFARVAARASK